MKDLISMIGVSIAATVGSYYIIREIQTDFLRVKVLYSDAQKSFKRKFKNQAA